MTNTMSNSWIFPGLPKAPLALPPLRHIHSQIPIYPMTILEAPSMDQWETPEDPRALLALLQCCKPQVRCYKCSHAPLTAFSQMLDKPVHWWETWQQSVSRGFHGDSCWLEGTLETWQQCKRQATKSLICTRKEGLHPTSEKKEV